MEDTPKYETDVAKFEGRYQPESMPVPVEQQTFFAAIERLSMRSDVDAAKIKQIMEMQEYILDRNAKQAFNVAMVKAQGRMEVVLKATKGEHGKFANLESVLEMARPIYTDEGFAVTFYEGFSTVEKPLKDGHIRMMADIMHAGGHTKAVTADVPFDDKGPQGKIIKTGPHATGSSFSYGRRYLNCMIWNIATGDDDDGRGAGGKISLLKGWDIKCDEARTAAKSADEMMLWWKTNSPAIKKELSKADAATIYEKANAYKKNLSVSEKEPGSDG